MCIHHLSKLICGMHSWKRYRQMTLSFNDSNVSPENRWSKVFSNFSPTIQHIKVTMDLIFMLQWLPQQQNDRLWSPAKSLHTFLPSGHLPFSQSSVTYSNSALQLYYLWTQWCRKKTKALGKTVEKGQFPTTCSINLPLSPQLPNVHRQPHTKASIPAPS